MSEKFMGLWPTPNASEDRTENYTVETSQKHYNEGRQIHVAQAVKIDMSKPVPSASPQLTLFAEDSLASHTVTPGSEEARKMTVTSGQSLSALLTNSDPVGLWLMRNLAIKCFRPDGTWRETDNIARRQFEGIGIPDVNMVYPDIKQDFIDLDWVEDTHPHNWTDIGMDDLWQYYPPTRRSDLSVG